MRRCFAPFEDVRILPEAEGFTAKVWGREYRYRNSVFPVSVRTAGEELLSAPVTLAARFGSVSGQWHDWEYTYMETFGESARVLVSAHCENVILNACLTFEMDGLVRTDLRIVPYWTIPFSPYQTNPPRLTELYFDVPLRAERGTLLHYWPNAENSIRVPGDVINSGVISEREFAFKPYLWCGWEDGGVGICFESEQGFQLEDRNRWVTITKSERQTNLHYRLLDSMPADWAERADDWTDALEPICFTIGLQATPVKPRREGDANVYRRFHLFDVVGANLSESDLPEHLASRGVRYVILHANWSRAENYGIAAEPQKLKALTDRFHLLGVKVLVYYGYEYSTMMPDWNQNAGRYLIKNVKGHFCGGWQAANLRAYMSCYRSDWAGALTENILSVIDAFGLDGIYTDGTYVPWECANESHGCGWRDRDGALHVTFPVYAVREFVKNLYAEIHSRGGVIETHQSACILMPTLAFADSCYDGENIQSSLEKNPGFLDTAAFRCEYAGFNTGLPMTFISYTTEKLSIEMLYAITLPHNVHAIPRTAQDLEFAAKVWQAFDKGRLDEREFVPYWRGGRKVTVSDGAVCSEWSGGGRLAAAVSNLSRESREVTLRADGYEHAENALTGESYALSGGCLTLLLEPFVPTLLEFLPGREK